MPFMSALADRPGWGWFFDRFFGSLGCEAGKRISRISNTTPANQLKIWKAIFGGIVKLISMRFMSGEGFGDFLLGLNLQRHR